jgi:hypothetical protein
MTYNDLQKKAKKCPDFSCKKCDFVCSKKSNYDAHIMTRKHVDTYIATSDDFKKKASGTLYKCSCGKQYKHRQSLYNHKKKCQKVHNPDDENSSLLENNNNNKYLMNLVIEVVKNNSVLQKQNNELQNKVIDLCKIEVNKYDCVNNTINNINSNNKTFNLQVFLNETCKDAMNIMDFVESIKLQLTDLENVGKVGFINGISNILVKNLKALDENKRPIHCTDKKREIMYVKDENKWEKDDTEYRKVRKAIKTIAKKNSKLLIEFKKQNPDCVNFDSKKSDKYNKMMVEAYGGSGNEDFENENKIIKNISKEVMINKDNEKNNKSNK